jgi:hypothetical protein
MPLKDPEKRREYNRNWFRKTGKSKEYYLKNLDYYKKWRASKKGKEAMAKGSKKYNCLRRHGMTLEEWKELYLEQDKCCAICGVYMEEKDAFIDHNHANGKNRELLCRHCNTGLGFFKDSIPTLEKAIEYLRKHNDN